jgi:hypothetical protein
MEFSIWAMVTGSSFTDFVPSVPVARLFGLQLAEPRAALYRVKFFGGHFSLFNFRSSRISLARLRV